MSEGEDDNRRYRDRVKDRAKKKAAKKAKKAGRKAGRKGGKRAGKKIGKKAGERIGKKSAGKAAGTKIGKKAGAQFVKKIGFNVIPIVGDLIAYFATDNSLTKTGLLVALLPSFYVTTAVVWAADILSIDIPLLVRHESPDPGDVNSLEASSRRDREYVTGADRRRGRESDDSSGISSSLVRWGGRLALVAFVLVGGFAAVSWYSSGGLGGVGQVAAEEVQDETVGGVAPGVTEDAGDATSSFLQTATAWTSCVSRGQTAGCVREWQLENTETKRPDSTDSTKSFDLKVSEEDFTLGRKGERFDVSSNPAERGIPIRMRASNVRRGIKGIDARNVEIRVSIVDGTIGEGALTGGALCDTGWIPIQDLPQIPGYDSDGDGKQDDLPPGAAVSSRLRLDKERTPESVSLDGDYITPKSCHMLQPSTGDGVETFLSVRYDYFSTAGLIFEAMSQDYILNQGISQNTKQSKSPDTPVQASLSVTGPVSAREDSTSSFNVQTLLETGESNVRFITKNMRLLNSRRACIQGEGLDDPECVTEGDGNPVSCSFRPSGDSQHRLKPRNNIMTRYREGPRTDNFFDDTDSPPIASCQMMLREPDSISRTGETLAIRMQANYTVVKDTQSDFEAANMLCTEKNCPHVFVLSGDSLNAKHLSATNNILENEDREDEIFWTHRRAECDAPDDAQDGCTAVSGDPQKGFEQAKKLDGGLKDSDGNFQIVEEGEIAMKIEDTSKDIFTACVRKDSVKNPDAMTGVHGVESSDLYQVTGDDADPQLNWTGAEWELEDEESPCKGSSGSGSGGSGSDGGASTSEDKSPKDEIYDETVENTQDSPDSGASSEDENTADDPYDYTAENNQDSSDSSKGTTGDTYSGT